MLIAFINPSAPLYHSMYYQYTLHVLLCPKAHSSVEKASLIGLVKMRLLPCDEKLSLRGEVLQQAVDKDRENGLIPFFVRPNVRVLFYFDQRTNPKP